MLSKLEWYARQLLPLTYRSRYRTADGRKHFAVWKMWLGCVFDYDDVVVAE